MTNLFLRLLLNKFERAVYKAAKKNGIVANTSISDTVPEFIVHVHGAHVNVAYHSGTTVDGIVIPTRYRLYALLKSLYEKNKIDAGKFERDVAYKAALAAINKKK